LYSNLIKIGFLNEDIKKDLPESIKTQILFYFKHYKELEKEKWVKIGQFKGKEQAKKIIEKAIKAYKQESK